MFGTKKKTKAVKKAEDDVETSKKKLSRAEKKAAKKAAVPPRTLFDKLTDPRTARRAISAAKVAGPALAPFALKAATSTRGWLDEHRARQLGVTALEVAAYRGPTGATGARVAGLTRSIEDLRGRRGGDLQVDRFVDVTQGRLADLTTAVRAAASMPANRRRATLAAVQRDLDRIDADLMTYLIPTAGLA